jgi:predicted ABC-type ATPase
LSKNLYVIAGCNGAGKIMLRRIDELLNNNETFALETTLGSKSYKNKIVNAQSKGYKVILLFFWLNNVSLAIKRVASRVKKGGHNIPTDVIRRRYFAGIANLFKIYLPICDEIIIIDKSEFGKIYSASKEYKTVTIENEEKWKTIKKLSIEKKIKLSIAILLKKI